MRNEKNGTERKKIGKERERKNGLVKERTNGKEGGK